MQTVPTQGGVFWGDRELRKYGYLSFCICVDGRQGGETYCFREVFFHLGPELVPPAGMFMFTATQQGGI